MGDAVASGFRWVCTMRVLFRIEDHGNNLKRPGSAGSRLGSMFNSAKMITDTNYSPRSLGKGLCIAYPTCNMSGMTANGKTNQDK